MIQRQWRHWLHFVPEVHLSEWFCFLNSQNCHRVEIGSNGVMLCLNMPNWPTNQTSCSITKHIFFFLLFWTIFGLRPFGFPTALWFVLSGLQSERVRRRARSKLQREAFFIIKLVVSELQWGRIHMSSYEEMKHFFQCFWKCFFDEEPPFLESCRESKYIKV